MARAKCSCGGTEWKFGKVKGVQRWRCNLCRKTRLGEESLEVEPVREDGVVGERTGGELLEGLILDLEGMK